MDGFRALSILIVLVYHYLVRWAPPFNPVDVYGYDRVYSPLFDLGQFGVHIFFVISGFVIAMTLLRSGSAVDFAVRRLARLYPAYAVVSLLVFGVLLVANGPFRSSPGDLAATLVLIAPHIHHDYVDGAFWTLLVEVKFYFWAACCWLLLRDRFWIGLSVVALAGAALFRVMPSVAEYLLVGRFMPLFLAGMGGWYLIEKRDRLVGSMLMAVALICYAMVGDRIVAAVSADTRLLAHMVIIGGSGLMLLLVRYARGLNLGPLALLGRASYSWYLVHQRLGVTAIAKMKAAFAWPDLLCAGLAMIGTGLLAILIYRCVEIPAQRAILKWWRAR